MTTKPSSILVALCVVVAVLGGTVLALLIALGLAMEIGLLPDSAARPAGRIPAQQLRQLREMGVTRQDEQVLYFYSTELFSIRGDGNLFTNQRVISYQELDGDFDIWEATYDEIADIEFTPGSWLEDSVITVTCQDEDWFVLYVSTESRGDLYFYNRLMEEWEKHRTVVAGHQLSTQSP